MDWLLHRIRSLPGFLLALLLVLTVLPLWSLSLQPPWELDPLPLAGFWVLPLGCVAAILGHSVAFLPLFALQIMAAIALTLSAEGELAIARIGAIVLASIMTLTVGRRDVIYPFLAMRARRWRLAPRADANARVALSWRDAGGNAISQTAILENYSLSGLVAVVAASEGAKALEAGVATRLGITARGRTVEIAADALRTTREGVFDRIAFRFQVHQDPRAFIDALMDATALDTNLERRFKRMMANSAFRRAALAGWSLSIVGAFGSPACGSADFGGSSESVSGNRPKPKVVGEVQAGGEIPLPALPPLPSPTADAVPDTATPVASAPPPPPAPMPAAVSDTVEAPPGIVHLGQPLIVPAQTADASFFWIESTASVFGPAL